jgi:hypothetical protein
MRAQNDVVSYELVPDSLLQLSLLIIFLDNQRGEVLRLQVFRNLDVFLAR